MYTAHVQHLQCFLDYNKYITVTTEQYNGVLRKWQFNCLFNSLLCLTKRQERKYQSAHKNITGPFWLESTAEQWNPLKKG